MGYEYRGVTSSGVKIRGKDDKRPLSKVKDLSSLVSLTMSGWVSDEDLVDVKECHSLQSFSIIDSSILTRKGLHQVAVLNIGEVKVTYCENFRFRKGSTCPLCLEKLPSISRSSPSPPPTGGDYTHSWGPTYFKVKCEHCSAVYEWKR